MRAVLSFYRPHSLMVIYFIMKEKIIKILKYIVVALIGAFTGVGVLIGVSSCQASNVKGANAESELSVNGVYHINSAEVINSYTRVYDSSNPIYDLDFGSYSVDIHFTNSYLLDREDWGNVYINYIKLYFTNYRNSHPTKHTFRYTSAYAYFSSGGETENVVLFDEMDNNFDYWRSSNTYSLVYLKNFDYFIFNDANINDSDNLNAKNNLINWIKEDFNILFVKYNDNTNFTFFDSWNYNAPYNSSISDMFIHDSTFTSTNAAAVVRKTYYFNSGFVSNGEFYDYIELYYTNGYGTRYIYDDGLSSTDNYRINESEGFGYWSTLFYGLQSNNSIKKLIATRINSNVVINGNINGALDYGSSWVNSNYKRLFFLDTITSEQNNNLAQFNNNIAVNGITNFSGNIGLSNVFSLLSLAFSSLIPIMSIQIIPGITIGLLVFLPLITGIILAIIWLVKR